MGQSHCFTKSQVSSLCCQVPNKDTKSRVKSKVKTGQSRVKANVLNLRFLFFIYIYIFFGGAFCAFIRTGQLKSGQETGDREGE